MYALSLTDPDSFLQKATGRDVWRAVGNTEARIDKMGTALRDAEGTILEGHEGRERGLIETHFPGELGKEPEAEEGTRGEGYLHLDVDLVGRLLAKTSTTAPGEDRMDAGILKKFLKWKEGLFISLGRHPTGLSPNSVEDDEGGGHPEGK